MAIFGSVNGGAKQITGLFGGVETYTCSYSEANTVFSNVNTYILCSGMKAAIPNDYKNVHTVTLTVSSGNVTRIQAFDSQSNELYSQYVQNRAAMLSTFGITLKLTPTGSASIGTVYTTVAKEIIELYGSAPVSVVVGVTGTIRSGGIGNVTAFDGEVFWNKVSSSLSSTALDYLRVDCDGTDFRLRLFYTDGTTASMLVNWGSANAVTEYGITIPSGSHAMGTDYIDLTPVTGTANVAKLIYTKPTV